MLTYIGASPTPSFGTKAEISATNGTLVLRNADTMPIGARTSAQTAIQCARTLLWL